MSVTLSDYLCHLSRMPQTGRGIVDWFANDWIVDTFLSKPPAEGFFLGTDGIANEMDLFSVMINEEDLVSLLEQLFEQNTINLMEGLSTPRVSQMMLTGID